ALRVCICFSARRNHIRPSTLCLFLSLSCPLNPHTIVADGVHYIFSTCLTAFCSSLQELCKELHQKIDVVDEARYDMGVKVGKNESEIQSLRHKIIELKGMKKPSLKRVKKTTDDMLGACTDASKLTKADFKANLKTVKKDEDKKEEVTDWRKNVEALSGMEGRKKLFNAGQ
uniref:Troponin I4b, tandem duplicate 1 n=1 Tax=Kryptolebias marmoratus TaxID=37003 RepID=A0A3Q3EXF6_KRYMA